MKEWSRLPLTAENENRDFVGVVLDIKYISKNI
jgi:hypothetical protein